MYENYKINIILLVDTDVFAGNTSASVGTGEVNPWSINPNRSDS